METQSARFTVLLGSIAALTSLSIDMTLPAAPAIEHSLGIAAGRAGLIMSVFLAGYAVTPLIGGPLADRFGRRPVLLTSLLLFAASTIACAASRSFTMLLAFRFAQGCASGVATTLPLAIVRDLLQGSEARRRISEIATSNSLMPIVAPIFGNGIMILGSWRILFNMQATFAVAMIAMLLLDFQESLPPARRQRLHPAQVLRSYGLLMRNRNFVGYSLIYAFNFVCIFSFISSSPLILMQRMAVQRSVYSLFFTLIAGGTILGSLTSGILSRCQRPPGQMISLGLWISFLASLAAAALQGMRLHQPAAIVAPAFLTLFGAGLSGPSVMLEALEPVPNLAGAGSGALRSILMIFGSGSSGLLAAYCARKPEHSEVAATLAMSGAGLASLVIYLGLLRGGRSSGRAAEGQKQATWKEQAPS
ncbi:MFS transporter, DHA1 family, bicyclomycin/chloramphenicol resistance protein [Granulicella rosea]|uniref:MFS transporter, DHA1 family, bicyclomycin/chloramphenicol resistance protein n=1 Tax=Granulicella rosea TaxID=474952 RepID=A0A239M4Y1_9BACT|nr:multidrug effflux MFS transporter [Granulicella rosea]SNT37755.1 MFS transporter, DHA1 family, bicyclomycin/chloramphenicol resistance protein [Granulicella rosea]